MRSCSFDGTGVQKWQPGKLAKDGSLDAEAATKDTFGSYHLHLEFRLSYMPQARGQSRSNSGVYVHDCYEIQVLDSFGLKGANNECGGFYSIKEPAVNMCLPPLQWQTYDIDFTAPKYEGEQKVTNARITVRHNGVVIHDNVELPKFTPGRKKEGAGPACSLSPRARQSRPLQQHLAGKAENNRSGSYPDRQRPITHLVPGR